MSKSTGIPGVNAPKLSRQQRAAQQAERREGRDPYAQANELSRRPGNAERERAKLAAKIKAARSILPVEGDAPEQGEAPKPRRKARKK